VHQKKQILLCCSFGVVRYWHGYLSGARYRWFADGPGDATATPSSLARVKSRMVYLPFWCRLTRVVLKKRPLNGCSSSSTVLLLWVGECIPALGDHWRFFSWERACGLKSESSLTFVMHKSHRLLKKSHLTNLLQVGRKSVTLQSPMSNPQTALRCADCQKAECLYFMLMVCLCRKAPITGSASCPSLREKAILLVKLSQHVEKRFPDDAELNAQFLELVYYVYRWTEIDSVSMTVMTV